MSTIGAFTEIPCAGASDELPEYQARIALPGTQYSLLTDLMSITFSTDTQHPATLLNLHSSAAPVVENVTSDDLNFFGQNLVFTQLLVGDSTMLL